MKKILAGLLLGAVILSTGASGVLAKQGHHGGSGHHGDNCGSCSGSYIDADNDGICDNCTQNAGCHFVDADNDGVCDLCNLKNGRHFVDADGDGICDTCGLKSGRHFVDADGDGICDNCGRKNKKHYNTSGNGRKNCKGHGKYSCRK